MFLILLIVSLLAYCPVLFLLYDSSVHFTTHIYTPAADLHWTGELSWRTCVLPVLFGPPVLSLRSCHRIPQTVCPAPPHPRTPSSAAAVGHGTRPAEHAWSSSEVRADGADGAVVLRVGAAESHLVAVPGAGAPALCLAPRAVGNKREGGTLWWKPSGGR